MTRRGTVFSPQGSCTQVPPTQACRVPHFPLVPHEQLSKALATVGVTQRSVRPRSQAWQAPSLRRQVGKATSVFEAPEQHRSLAVAQVPQVPDTVHTPFEHESHC